jgi:hypothetical protein
LRLKTVLLMAVGAPLMGYAVFQLLWWGVYVGLQLNHISPAAFAIYPWSVGISVTAGAAALFYFTTRKRKRKQKNKRTQKNLERDVKIKDVVELLPGKQPPKVEFNVIGEGVNHHSVLDWKENAEYTGESGTVYKLKDENLGVSNSLFGGKKYVAIFKENGEAVKPSGNLSKDFITSEILYIADKSSALSRGITEKFSTSLPLKKILFFVAIPIIAIAVIYVLTGGFMF